MDRYNYDNDVVVVTEEDVKKAKGKGFFSGFMTCLLLTGLVAGGSYLYLASGDQRTFEYTEPDINLPQVETEIEVNEAGQFESGEAEVKSTEVVD